MVGHQDRRHEPVEFPISLMTSTARGYNKDFHRTLVFRFWCDLHAARQMPTRVRAHSWLSMFRKRSLAHPAGEFKSVVTDLQTHRSDFRGHPAV